VRRDLLRGPRRFISGDDVAEGVTLGEAARRAGVAPATLRRWAREGLVPPLADGAWPPAAVAHARMVARLRERGRSVAEIRDATASGRLVVGYLDDVLPAADVAARVSLEEAARRTGLDPALIARLFLSLGFSADALDRIAESDLVLLDYVAAILDAGLPREALQQLARVYGQALAQVADAEVRLFHLYVHEPLLRDGVPGLEVAEELEGLTRALLPLASPIMDHVHRRFLAHFVEQDVVGHLEDDLDSSSLDLGRIRVAIAFADLAGYTRLTEEEGEEEAVNAVERFTELVEVTLPDDARVVKTIGDEVMVVGSDPAALVDWAVGFQEIQSGRPLPRVGVHHGRVVYRDGDFYGREVNLASRVVARAAGGEVVVTRPLVEAAGDHLEFERIGEVRLKGFEQSTELFLARGAEDG
jgi:adenylate cyclase